MASSPDSLQVETLRSFNRFYTKHIGVLDERLLKTRFTLTQARVLFELGTRKSTHLLDGVTAFDVSADGEKALYQQGDKWFIAAVAGGPPKADKPLRTEEMEVRVDPRAEWKQMYHEAWRLQRDFLYDPHFHGLDIAAAEKKYAVFLDGNTRAPDIGRVTFRKE